MELLVTMTQTKGNKMKPEFKEAFDKYFAGCQEVYDAYIVRNGFDSQWKEFSFTVGRKYVKVIGGGGVHSFVNMINGDVLKPAGWSKPAKHARGNVYDMSNGLAGMTAQGPYYL
jgi:hypothetical protein